MDEDETRTVDGPQGALRVRVDRAEGDRPAVLLLHSDGGRLEQWDEVVVASADDSFPLARMDFRGHGGSAPAADADYSFAGRADDVAAVLDALDWDRVLLVAHSGGNGAALTAIAADPARYAGLVMVDPPSDPTALPEEVRREFLAGLAGPDSLAYLRQYYRTIAGSDEAVVARVLDDGGATSADARAGLGPALLTWSAALADAVDVPLSLLGTDVSDGPNALWAQRPDIPHRVVHGTGHWVNIERPDEVVADIRALHDRG